MSRTEHGLGCSFVPQRHLQRRGAQPPPGVGNERAHEHPLRRRAGAVATTPTPEAAGETEGQPTRRPVHRATESLRVHERLQQQQPVTETHRPLPHHPARAQPQHPRAQVRTPKPRRQQHKPGVVRHQVQPPVLPAKVPPNPLIARSAFERRRREHHQGQPLTAPMGDVPNTLSDLRRRAQVVMRLHQRPETRLLVHRDRGHLHLAQLHRSNAPLVVVPMTTNRSAAHLIREPAG